MLYLFLLLFGRKRRLASQEEEKKTHPGCPKKCVKIQTVMEWPTVQPPPGQDNRPPGHWGFKPHSGDLWMGIPKSVDRPADPSERILAFPDPVKAPPERLPREQAGTWPPGRSSGEAAGRGAARSHTHKGICRHGCSHRLRSILHPTP